MTSRVGIRSLTATLVAVVAALLFPLMLTKAGFFHAGEVIFMRRGLQKVRQKFPLLRSADERT